VNRLPGVVQPAGASSLTVEPAGPDDFPQIAELTVRVYVGGGLASPGYAPELADVAGRATRAQLLVVRDPGGVVGSVALVLGGDFANTARSDDEAEIRMLVVDPSVQGGGLGELLVTACLDRARAAGRTRMVLSTDLRMAAAIRLYERLGFTRLTERDWAPEPGIDLIAYGRDL
jgi:ribosomal protein S18 acetylase RimI-like enzyme